MPDIFEYENFHIYLSAYYEEKKKLNRNYSFAVMAQQFGISDRTFVHHIVKIARTKLPAPYIIKISESLRLTKREAEYFNHMVAYTHYLQDDNARECTVFKKKMDDLRKKVKLQEIRKDQNNFYSQWYHSVILSVIGMYSFKGDYSQLGRTLTPPITEIQAKESVELLERLGLVVRDNKDVYRLTTEKNIRTGREFSTAEKNRFHLEYLKVTKEALQNNVAGLQVASMTLGISEKTYRFIHEETMELREKIRKMVDNETEADRVFLYQSILVPLTKNGIQKPSAR